MPPASTLSLLLPPTPPPPQHSPSLCISSPCPLLYARTVHERISCSLCFPFESFFHFFFFILKHIQVDEFEFIYNLVGFPSVAPQRLRFATARTFLGTMSSGAERGSLFQIRATLTDKARCSANIYRSHHSLFHFFFFFYSLENWTQYSRKPPKSQSLALPHCALLLILGERSPAFRRF